MRISSAIGIPLNHPDYRNIKESLEFPNPFDEEVFSAYQETGGYLIIPRGYPLVINDYTKDFVETKANIEVSSSYSLRPYQQPIVDGILQYFSAMEYAQCLLEADTGSGKTYALAGILSSLKRKTLILSHLTMLGDQMLKELTTNLSQGSSGVLSAKSLGIALPDIAISSFQLLSQNSELLNYIRDHYSVVVVDECENAVTTGRLKVLFSLRAQYQIYLTATPSKELVQQTQAVTHLYGGKVFHMEAPKEYQLVPRFFTVDFRHLNWESPYNSMLYKTSLGKFLTTSEILPWVVSLCSGLKAQGFKGTIWIIVDLNKLQDQLEMQLVKQGLRVGIIRGTTSKKQRDQLLRDIHEYNLDVLLGSAPLSAGLSIPEISMGIRLMPHSSSEELLKQQIGRTKRNIHWKTLQPPLWIDFAISGSLLYGARKRFSYYTKAIMAKPKDILNRILG